MRILGIDPGSVVCGYGVIDVTAGNKLELVEYGVIEAKRQYTELPRRLEVIFNRVSSLIERTMPDEAAFEEIFYAKNVQSILKLSHARGVAMLAATLRQIPISEYAALQVKQCVSGKGRASKEQVQFMVQKMLGIKEQHKYLDATDALAIAITHALRGHHPISKAKQKVRQDLANSVSTTSKVKATASKKKDAWSAFVKENPHRLVR